MLQATWCKCWAGGAGHLRARARGDAADSLSSGRGRRHASERKLAAASERVPRVERRAPYRPTVRAIHRYSPLL
ncbi:unnamed protein product [Euphydryas editha]|uniref:Uncharacterized protein n=1 Tax=Euphydryas editha TaxID=104508 RepID=A0AAU9TFQ5_EUPED|nr:unnamed protein product [Euphydryas editha]